MVQEKTDYSNKISFELFPFYMRASHMFNFVFKGLLSIIFLDAKSQNEFMPSNLFDRIFPLNSRKLDHHYFPP